jgi:hypothetical protein
MRQGLFHQHIYRGIVHHVAGLVDQAILARGGEGIQRHIGDHAQARNLLFQCCHSTLRQAVGIPGFAAIQ